MNAITSWEELSQHDGKEVVVQGTYTWYNPFPGFKKKRPISWIVQIVLDQETSEGPFLEAYWDEASDRSQEEMDTYQDQEVLVSGMFHLEQPSQPGDDGSYAAFGGPCLTQVKVIGLAEKPGEE